MRNRCDDGCGNCIADGADSSADNARAAPPWQTPQDGNKSAPPEEHPATKADDKAYKSALDKIPPKQAHDPWGNVREKPQSNNSR